MFLACQEKTRLLVGMPSKEQLRKHSLCELWFLQKGGMCLCKMGQAEGSGGRVAADPAGLQLRKLGALENSMGQLIS